EGDQVNSGDVIAEIETDKATMEVESADDGIVGRLLVADGTADIPVGTVIAVLLEEGEDAADIKTPAQDAPKLQAEAEAPKAGAAKPASRAEEPKAEAKPAKASATASAAPVAKPAGASGDRILASPLARRMAEQQGIDLSAIKGSGPGGRIVKRDLGGVEAAPAPAAAAAPGRAAAPAPAAAPVVGDAPYEERRLTTMRKVIAERMTEAKSTVPHFYLNVEVAMDRLL